MNFLLLRGWTREKRHWGQFPQILQTQLGTEQCQVFSIDLPGMGEFYRQSAERTISKTTSHVRERWQQLAQQYPGDWALISISLGGMVALDWGARWPQDWCQIYLINSSAALLSPPWHRLRPSAYPQLLKIIREKQVDQREKQVLELMTNFHQQTLAQWPAWAQYAKEHPVSLRNALVQLGAGLIFVAPKALAVPLVVIASKADRIVSYRCSRAIANKYQAPFHLHPTAGHDLPADDPEFLAATISSTLSGKLSQSFS